MGTVNVGYRRGADGTADTNPGLSGFWGDCPILSTLEDRQAAYGYIEDGLGIPTIESTDRTGGYVATITATGTPQFGSDDVIGGTLLMKNGTADNDGIDAVYGGTKTAPFRISDAETEARKLWFEIGVIPGLITATQQEMFVGLCETYDAAADGLLEDAGGIDSERDLIGFFKPQGDAGTVDFIYQKGTQTLQTVLNGYTTLNTSTATKLGFVYDPKAPASERIRIYTNGILESTFVTATQIAVSATTGFPDAIKMAPTFALKNSVATTQQTLQIPFWGCYQLF